MTRIALPSSSWIESFSLKGTAVYAVRAAERVMATYVECSGAGRRVIPAPENRMIQSIVTLKKMICLFPAVQPLLLEQSRNASADLFQLECEILRRLEENISGELGFELAAAGAAVNAAKSAADAGLVIAESLIQTGRVGLEVSASDLAFEASSYSVEAAHYADPSSVDPLIQQFIRDAGILEKLRMDGFSLTFDDLPPLWISFTPAWLR